LEAAGGGIKWSAVTSDLTASSNTGLITESGSRLVVTLPATAALGDVVIVQGFASGGWQIAQGGDNTQIFLGNQATAPGAGNGYLSSTQEEDSVSLVSGSISCYMNAGDTMEMIFSAGLTPKTISISGMTGYGPAPFFSGNLIMAI
ncbi:MAG: hypothetical protein ABSB40_12235, partial [Nitrososphaeria archaeon]